MAGAADGAGLAPGTVAARQRAVRAFAAHAGAFPWSWTAELADEWFTDPRAVRGLRASTLRGYQEAVRLFCAYVTDPAYGWPAQCLARFGTHPVQVCHEWNTAVHVQDAEADPRKRAFTRDELQALFDYADDQVTVIRAAGRKGWLAAFRDAALFKVAYGFGLRRTETAMLDTADFGASPHAPEFGELGVCYVRYGKAMKGSPPRRRSVLTIWPWVAEVLAEWTGQIRPLQGPEGNPGAVDHRAGPADQRAPEATLADALGDQALSPSPQCRASASRSRTTTTRGRGGAWTRSRWITCSWMPASSACTRARRLSWCWPPGESPPAASPRSSA